MEQVQAESLELEDLREIGPQWGQIPAALSPGHLSPVGRLPEFPGLERGL